LGELSGLAGQDFTINWIQQETIMLLREAPEALKSAGVEALLVDQATPAGGTIADFLKLPFITICNALLRYPEAGVPPYFTSWNYSQAWWARLRNQVGNYFFAHITQPSGRLLCSNVSNGSYHPIIVVMMPTHN
jgi:hypothetical protein